MSAGKFVRKNLWEIWIKSERSSYTACTKLFRKIAILENYIKVPAKHQWQNPFYFDPNTLPKNNFVCVPENFKILCDAGNYWRSFSVGTPWVTWWARNGELCWTIFKPIENTKFKLFWQKHWNCKRRQYWFSLIFRKVEMFLSGV